MLILRDLFTGTKRFGELKKSLTGISQKVLTANQKDMEANGLLARKAYPEVPPCVEYTLTETGESLTHIPGAMFDWGMDYKRKNNLPSSEREDVLGKVLYCSHICTQDKTAASPTIRSRFIMHPTVRVK